MIEEYTTARFEEVVRDAYGAEAMPEVRAMVNRWLARGDGAAVYQNHLLGHPELGHIKIVSYGSPAAQLEVGQEDLPDRLPDGLPAGAINWRYSLVGTYHGGQLDYVLAKFVPTYPVESQVAKRPGHIVLNHPRRYRGFALPALCGVNVTRKVDGKVTDSRCNKCRTIAVDMGIIVAPPELSDPVHHGDIFSRIEASQE